MYQQEIQFFFPMTEQIQLDLDYSKCVSKQLYTSLKTVPSGSFLSVVNGDTWTTTSFRLQENETTMIVLKKPNLLRKLVFKLLGFKWEIK